MAQNIYRKNTVKNDKQKHKEKPKADKQTAKNVKINIFKDKRLHLVTGLLLIFVSFFVLFSLFSFFFTGQSDQSIVQSLWETGVRKSGSEVDNWLGITGAVVAHFLVYKCFGIASLLLIPVFFLTGLKILFKSSPVSLFNAVKVSLFFTLWLSIAFGYLALSTGKEDTIGFLGGGIGYELATVFDDLIGWGTYLFLIFMLLCFIIFTLNITTIGESPNAADINKPAGDEANPFASDDSGKYEDNAFNQPAASAPDNNEGTASASQHAEEAKEKTEETSEVDLYQNEHKKQAEKTKEAPDLELEVEDTTQNYTTEHTDAEKENQEEKAVNQATAQSEKAEDKPELTINETSEEKTTDASTTVEHGELQPYDPKLDLSHYKFPPFDLLNDYGENKIQVTKEELEGNKDRIIETLSNFKIGISSIKATIGPTVTLYEIVPEKGVKISKITNLADDIALSLSALGIRIIAPIPGKGTIGIEVPNKKREMVSALSVLSSEKFEKTDMELPIVFGKTISNEIYIADLNKMPHILMAGATGMGKSVGINMLLTSLLYKKHPSQLKFVLIDPKKVELSLYNKIEKHFLAMLPDSEEAIVTDTKQVVNTLHSLCVEMDARYSLLKNAECRNLAEYNPKFIKRKLNPNEGHRYLPYIVLIIDELADLMMTAGKEVEQPIARLAQLARAVGIHLVVATQRPSVNVITGTIKTNFPARLSFRVTSKIDSRTILDEGGAEQLIGKGDMLLNLGSESIRLQCAFADTPEVERVVEFIESQQGYESAYMLPEYYDDKDSSNGTKSSDLDERDELFEEAARTIVSHQQGSTSLLQRKMKLGYNRAGRLMDQLEAAGIVGGFEGSKARQVLVSDEYALEQVLNELQAKNE